MTEYLSTHVYLYKVHQTYSYVWDFVCVFIFNPFYLMTE